MRGWAQSTFVFVSTNTHPVQGGVEETWLAVMAELVRLGATVQLLCISGSGFADDARAAGVTVAPYILDKWNVVRSRSRLRKYLKRYEPVCAHSTGVEADLLLRWAVRPLTGIRMVTTISGPPQGTRRRGLIDKLMLRFDEAGIARSDAVFVTDDSSLPEIVAAGVAPGDIVIDVPTATHRESVARHLAVYRGFMASRGAGG